MPLRGANSYLNSTFVTMLVERKSSRAVAGSLAEANDTVHRLATVGSALKSSREGSLPGKKVPECPTRLRYASN